MHRRNLTRIVENTGHPARYERIAACLTASPRTRHGLRPGSRQEGRFVFGYAAYADAKMSGAGGVLRLKPGKPPEEVAYGLRCAAGWCAGPDGEVFFTDSQGDWVASTSFATSKREVLRLAEPIAATAHHEARGQGGGLGPLRLGAINQRNRIRQHGRQVRPFRRAVLHGGVDVRRRDHPGQRREGERRLPGPASRSGAGPARPLTLAFDPRGKLYVGGITEPGWMAQPDRGALFRIDYTGEVPFEMQSIHVRPQGFKIVFTSPVDRKTAENPESYHLEHYRYEYTGAYGSPELDRTAVKLERVEVAADGKSAELTTKELVKDRVYMITPSGVRSADGKKLVNPTGAYTLNEVPADK